MRFTIRDVGHGFCADLRHDNGNVMLWDCGHKSEPEYRPSSFLPKASVTRIGRFTVTNYDEDHISDLVALRENLPIDVLARNTTVNADELRKIKKKSGPISPAMESLLEMIKKYDQDVPPGERQKKFPNVELAAFRHEFGGPFGDDTNDNSLVTFLHCSAINVVIPGDLGAAAWEKFLEKPDFREHLSRTKVFIASHHGRIDGYCKKVFDYCTPSCVVFSDSETVHATQETEALYRKHATGTKFNGTTRFVLTTRRDGTFHWG